MRRNGYIVLLIAAIAWIAVAIVLATGNPSGARTVVPPSGASPACLPSTLEHAATLAGTSLDVSPAPETGSANPSTQISFRGIPVTDIQDVAVEGSHSGYHYGHLYGYFQGDGGSFVPDKPFTAGERVEVRALVGAADAQRRIAFGFAVATPFSTAAIPGFPNPSAPPSAVQSFASDPELHPPLLAVTSADQDPAAGDILMTSGPGPGQAGPLIYTPQGRVLWFDALPTGENALDLSVQSYEGQRDLTFWQGHIVALGFGQGEDVVMNANYQEIATVRAGNGYQADLHDFQIAPNDVAYVTAYNPIRCDLSSVGGARNGVLIDTVVQQVDMKTGLVRWEWHSVDHVAVGESHVVVPTTPTPWDAFHLNSIDPEPDGNVLISARSTWAAYQLDGHSGEIIWRLGGTHSSFAMGPGTETAWQHDARIHADGTVTIFDDGSNPRVHYQSRGIRLALGTTDHRATLLAAYPHPGGPLLADSQGNMQSLPDGNAVIGWGAIPSISELAPDGRLLLDAHMPAGYSSYRAFRFPWGGHPLWPPNVSAHLNATADSTTVYASWNGDGEVSSWRVLAGSGPASLTAQATMPDSAFESWVTYPTAYPYVAVQALGSAGQLLGTSATVQVAK
ncbi:MAG TPA: arylsulfotransferase family protein [Solirubrobacteraceae bacterium]|nr:arylsulfotransferase family protein [Solirubrobacteraceae bacterium]